MNLYIDTRGPRRLPYINHKLCHSSLLKKNVILTNFNNQSFCYIFVQMLSWFHKQLFSPHRWGNKTALWITGPLSFSGSGNGSHGWMSDHTGVQLDVTFFPTWLQSRHIFSSNHHEEKCFWVLVYNIWSGSNTWTKSKPIQLWLQINNYFMYSKDILWYTSLNKHS